MKYLKFLLSLCLMFFITSGATFADDIVSAASGDWNTAATWDPQQVPIAGDNVTILSDHTITLAAVGECENLTMEAGATLSLNAISLTVPGNNWYLDPASTVIYNGTTTIQTGPTYGNLIYSSASGGPGPNTTLTIAGNLTVTTATLRGIAATPGTNTINVAGNVIIGPGTGARISGVNLSSETAANCTWNIGGKVSLTGNNSGNRVILFESAGPHTGYAIYNINGDLDIGTNSSVALRSSTSSTATSTGTINIKGNILNNGTIRSQTGTAGSFIINMNGTSAQQYTGISPSAFPTGQTFTLNFDNAAGITLNNMITVNTNVSIVAVNGSITAGSSNYIYGPLSKTWGSTGSFTYPVGDVSNYSPVTLNFTSGTFTSASVMVQAFGAKHPSNTSTTDYLNRYWTVTQSGIADFACNADFVYVDGDVAGTESNLVLGQYGTQWNVVGTVTAGTNTLSATSLTSFSDFTGGEADALPVQLASFVGNVVGNNAQLEWQTISEINNYGFNVQRYDAISKSYNNVGFVAGKGIPYTYTYEDKNVSGSLEYRLEQIDNNGLTSYFGPIMLNPNSVGSDAVPAVFALNQNYPNPFNPSTIINYQLAIDNYTTLKVYNLIGKEVATLVNGNQSAGSHQVTFDGSALTSGVYFYKLQSGSNVEVKKLTLVK
jgi:hypothetical protein